MIYHMKNLLDQRLNPLYQTAIQGTAEGILHLLCMAREMEGANGNYVPALPLQEVKEIVERSALKARPPRPPPSKPPPPPPEAPRVAEAPPSAARGAEGMMTVPLPKPET